MESGPKRLRYFVHRDARLPGEISRLLASALTDFYHRRAAARKAVRAWAACLKKVFEVSPVLCVKCGGVIRRY